MATHKIEGPATQVTFLGVIVDTARFELRLPTRQVRVYKIISALMAWTSLRDGIRSLNPCLATSLMRRL